MKQTACKDCTKRYPGCHSPGECPDYVQPRDTYYDPDKVLARDMSEIEKQRRQRIGLQNNY